MSEREWITLTQAVELTGMKRATITYMARTKRVRKIEGSGPRSHKYNVADLLEMKDEHTPRQYTPRGGHHDEPSPVLIDWIRSTDVAAGLVLAQQLYDDDVDLADTVRYQAWRKYNQYLSMGAFSLDRKECYAALMLVPLEETTILDVLSGRRLESSLTTEDVLLYDRPGGYTLLAASALCLPDRPGLLYRVLARMIDYWIEQYPERYIARIYAQAVSEQGFTLIQHVFMSPLYAFGPEAYVLDMSYPSASKVIRRFKERLEEKAPLPAELSRPTVPAALVHHVETPAPAPARPPAAAAPIVASVPTPRQKPATQSDTLPEEYKSFTDMFKDHGIAETTANRGRSSGKFSTIEGRWYARGRLVRYALDQAQQQAFIQAYQGYESFHQCAAPACPCHNN